MKTTIKKKNDSLRELSVKLVWADIKSDYINKFNKIKSSYQLPGFRKGKVPEQIF